MPLAQPRPGYSVMVFTDASDIHWGAMVTQVPDNDLWAEGDPVQMHHQPLEVDHFGDRNFDGLH